MTSIPRANLEDKVGFHWALKGSGCLGYFGGRKNPAFFPHTPARIWENTPLLKPLRPLPQVLQGMKRLHILKELGRDSKFTLGIKTFSEEALAGGQRACALEGQPDSRTVTAATTDGAPPAARHWRRLRKCALPFHLPGVLRNTASLILPMGGTDTCAGHAPSWLGSRDRGRVGQLGLGQRVNR